MCKAVSTVVTRRAKVTSNQSRVGERPKINFLKIDLVDQKAPFPSSRLNETGKPLGIKKQQGVLDRRIKQDKSRAKVIVSSQLFCFQNH